jgi:hypothetical protein
MPRIGKRMGGKKSPAIGKPLQVRGCDDCLQDRTEWALWQISLILADIAANTWGDRDHKDEGLPTAGGGSKNEGKQQLPHQ